MVGRHQLHKLMNKAGMSSYLSMGHSGPLEFNSRTRSFLPFLLSCWGRATMDSGTQDGKRNKVEEKSVWNKLLERNSALKTCWQLVAPSSGSPEADKFGRSAALARVLYPRTQVFFTELGSFSFTEESGAGAEFLQHQHRFFHSISLLTSNPSLNLPL